MQNAEPGWMAGEIRGHTGWFPESYVEPVDTGTTDLDNERTFIQQDSVEKRTLELVIFIYVNIKSLTLCITKCQAFYRDFAEK